MNLTGVRKSHSPVNFRHLSVNFNIINTLPLQYCFRQSTDRMPRRRCASATSALFLQDVAVRDRTFGEEIIFFLPFRVSCGKCNIEQKLRKVLLVKSSAAKFDPVAVANFAQRRRSLKKHTSYGVAYPH